MSTVLFRKLWENHPYPNHPCDKETFKNQCAIRMGVALEKSGIDTQSFDIMYPKRRCYPGFKHSPRHILAAQELANWVKSKASIFGAVKVSRDVTSQNFRHLKGIVFIKNSWGPTDHIDVWDGLDLKGGSPAFFALAQEVWFWELKL